MASYLRSAWNAACAILWLLGLAACFAQPAGKDAPARVSAGIEFRCLWWSEAQMEGLNPNAPPPKTTDVQIKKWEYSDPVGVPHPDVVDIVVNLKNNTAQTLSGLEVDVSGQWMTGLMSKRAEATWADPIILKTVHDVSLAPGSTENFRVPVDLRTKMTTLEQVQKWPYTVRAIVKVNAPGSGRAALVIVKAELPITPGD
ncbi:MAG TPA: hypothetical protein VK670_04350 [Silvibacterium sp.]|nr:hypothetical protein [Silvibacterium sp.]